MPSIKQEIKSNLVSFRLKKFQLEQLAELAKLKDLSISDLARDLIFGEIDLQKLINREKAKHKGIKQPIDMTDEEIIQLVEHLSDGIPESDRYNLEELKKSKDLKQIMKILFQSTSDSRSANETVRDTLLYKQNKLNQNIPTPNLVSNQKKIDTKK